MSSGKTVSINTDANTTMGVPSFAGGPTPIETSLKEQNLGNLDVNVLTPLTPEVISRQATINIGTIGHVAHGKSTVVKAISGIKTIKFKNELVRNITIKLGYANAKIYRSTTAPYVYEAQSSDFVDVYLSSTGVKMELVRHVSFVDCPGHDVLMATMLNGAAVMDAALLLVAGNERCPQPQTSEHLAAVEIMQLKNIIILQNKIDLVKEDAAKTHYDEIKAFVSGTVAGDAPIIPISAQLKYNIDRVCKNIVCRVPVPPRDFTSPPRMIIIRSFDVNHPGFEASKLQGGIAGGSILQGVLKCGDEVEIRPGVATRDDNGRQIVTPIFSRIVSLQAERNSLQFAVPGGLIGVGLTIDPTLTRADRLVGQVLGAKGTLPDIYSEIEVSFFLLKRLLGVKTNDGERAAKVAKLEKGETLMVNIGSTSTGCTVLSVKNDVARIQLIHTVCTNPDEKVALSRRIQGHFRLIGWGKILSGVRLKDTQDGSYVVEAASS